MAGGPFGLPAVIMFARRGQFFLVRARVGVVVEGPTVGSRLMLGEGSWSRG